MLKPRRLRPGDRVAVTAPASGFRKDSFERGVDELRRLGFSPVYDDSVFDRRGYVAGDAETRARAVRGALQDPSIAAIIAVRGGYGSVQILPLLDRAEVRSAKKALIGYSDITSLLTYVTCHCGLVAFHGPMLDGRLARGEDGYDRQSFLGALTADAALGEMSPSGLECVAPGEAAGPLMGGTLTQLAASLGTPYAFDPPAGSVLFFDEVGERPYRIDRLLTQLRFAGILARASALLFGELPRCDEPGGAPTARSVIGDILSGFPGPILVGFPSGHTTDASPALTLPLGVTTRLVASPQPRVIVEETATEG